MRKNLVLLVHLLLVCIIVAGCFPARAKITIEARPPQLPVDPGRGILGVTLLAGSNVDWAWLYIEGPNSKIERRINRGTERQFRLEAGKSYRITLRRVMQGREYLLTRELYIERDKTYNIRHNL